MKGIMVTLLTIGLTGMVSGQQPQNNSNSFGSQFANPSAEQFQRLAQGSNSRSGQFDQATPDAAPRLGPLEMMLTDRIIESFKRQGDLTGDVKPVQAVNEIIFTFGDENGNPINANSANGKSMGLIKPLDKRGNTLVFEMDDFDLARIKTDGLSYRYDAFELGKYSTVKVFYKSARGQQPTAIRQPAQDNNGRLDSNRADWSNPNLSNGNQNFGNDPRMANNNFSSNPANDTPRPYDPNFMGPTFGPATGNGTFNNQNSQNFAPQQSAQGTFQQQQAPPSNPSRWSPIPNPGNGLANSSGNGGQFGGDTNRNQPTGNGLTPRDFFNTMNSTGDPRNQSNTSTQSGGNNQNPNSQFGSNPQINNNPNGLQTLNNFTPTNNSPSTGGFASNNSGNQNSWGNNGTNNGNGGYQPTNNGNMLTELEQRQQFLANRKAQALEQQTILDQQELAEIEQQNYLKQQASDRRQRETSLLQADLQRRTGQPSAGNGINQFNNGLSDPYTPTSGRSYGDQLTYGNGSPPDRMASNQNLQPTNTGVRDWVGAIPGPGTDNRSGVGNGTNPVLNGLNNPQNGLLGENRDASLEGVMFFMLLFSLALNVYLGWISRGFYVRYNELADELRETFTASM